MTAGEATREYYREQGRQQEQERIIQLITESQEVIFDDNFEDWDVESIPRLFEDVQAFDMDVDGFRNRLIAFIKGEKQWMN